jgi:hypothetical protein
MAYDMETAVRIPYDEYRVITTLMHAHLQTHEGKLRAIIAFGDIVTKGNTFDIDLLEIVEDWQGQRSVVFASSAALPLRGQMRLYLITPEEFEQPENLADFSTRSLLERVRAGYDVIYEDPSGYARDILARRVKDGFSDNPLGFLADGNLGKP